MMRLLLFFISIISILGDCAFKVDQDLKPYIPEGDEVTPKPITWNVSCSEWMEQGKLGCCNENSYTQTSQSFQKINTIFASSISGGSGGCDLCAINLKRFWCQYSCDPNQSSFTRIGDWVYVPSFDHPGEQVFVQQVFLTVQSTTACRLFQSCQRTSYAAQLSALQNPAGFLNFQGTNAIQDASQIIYVDFTDDKTKGLYIQQLDNCSYKLPPVGQLYRGFQVIANCSCNTCESQCSSGTNYYQPTPVMEGFNAVVVASVWGGVIGFIALLTVYRVFREKRKKE